MPSNASYIYNAVQWLIDTALLVVSEFITHAGCIAAAVG